MLLDRLRYVHEDIDRHGNVRVYFWRGKGHRRIRLRAPVGSPEFRRAYDAALIEDTASAPPQPEGPAPAKQGTWRWLCQRYFTESQAFKRLNPRTRKVRRQILTGTFTEPIAPGDAMPFGDVLVQHFGTLAVKVLRDRKGDAIEAGNDRVKAIRQVFAWAIEAEVKGITGNPARDVAYVRAGGDGFHTWTRDEVGAYEKRHPSGTKARLALALLLYTGARRSDVVVMGPAGAKDGWLTFAEKKGAGRKPKLTRIPILPPLARELAAGATGSVAWLETAFGRPFTANGFGNWFRARCDEAGLPHCSAHGLRKAGATIAAENGATEHQLMAIYGWESTKQAAVYTRKANRKKLAGAAMHLIDPDMK